MTKIILLRHGQTNWNKEGRYQGQIDTDLSELGKEQAKLLSNALKKIKIDEFIASPLKRAYETACESAKFHNKQVIKDERLLEINHGTWEGKLSSEVEKMDKELLKMWKQTPHLVKMPNGENLQDILNRALPCVVEFAKKYDGKTIAFFAHDAVNKVLLAHFLNAPLSSFWNILQDNTCINVVEFNDDLFKIVTLNNTNHLGYLFSGEIQLGL
ncbi:histidine phosphatase family protein [Campylobacter sp. MG1]|uniref:histidine phosphatase family protein n=1 Tax=Campylobacter sp. MG1 TaxID=2976332 RepID=UPI00226CBC1A|nr:histidine phosphatase family protein [Campylobacter sp. MG1]